MAKLLKMLNNPYNVEEVIEQYSIAAENSRKIEYKAAVVLQSWVRGLKTRRYIQYLNTSATNIQRRWRGFLVRSHFRIFVSNLHIIMQQNFYNVMAVRIQRIWRGYHSRKYIHNFYERKKYFAALAVKNQVVRYELDKWRNDLDEARYNSKLKMHQEKLIIEAKRNHFMLSTVQKPGVFNSPFRKTNSLDYDIEKQMRIYRPMPGETLYQAQSPDPFNGCVEPLPTNVPKKLPPINTTKIQGPFKDRITVYQQKHKPLGKSIRGKFDSVEQERVKAIQSERSKVLAGSWLVDKWNKDIEYKYQRLLHSHSVYTDSHKKDREGFRMINKKALKGKRFINTVSSVPIFSEFGKTYYTGEVKLV